jgi:hypothetical protein
VERLSPATDSTLPIAPTSSSRVVAARTRSTNSGSRRLARRHETTRTARPASRRDPVKTTARSIEGPPATSGRARTKLTQRSVMPSCSTMVRTNPTVGARGRKTTSAAASSRSTRSNSATVSVSGPTRTGSPVTNGEIVARAIGLGRFGGGSCHAVPTLARAGELPPRAAIPAAATGSARTVWARARLRDRLRLVDRHLPPLGWPRRCRHRHLEHPFLKEALACSGSMPPGAGPRGETGRRCARCVEPFRFSSRSGAARPRS